MADGTYGNGMNGVKGNVSGLFYGNPGQFCAQFIDIGVLIVWGFGISFLWFKLLDKVRGLRVDPKVELEGLDLDEMGTYGYPDFQLVKSGELDSLSSSNAEIKALKNVKYRFRIKVR